MIRTRSVVTGGLAAAILFSTGCAAPPAPTGSIEATGPTSSAAVDLALVDVRLDPASRDLLTVLGPADPVVAQVQTTQGDELAAAARPIGLDVELFPGAISVRGPLDKVLEVIATVPVTGIQLDDDPAAERPIPLERPIVPVPVPGRPYVLSGVTGDQAELRIPSPQREPMLRSLGALIRTIDGQPYRRLQVDGSCNREPAGEICRISAIGWAAGSGNREDDLALDGTAGTGWSGILEADSVSLWSVPRPILRSAEWTARHDPAAAAAIHRYATCCNGGWDPGHPGWIRLAYLRPCPASVVPPGRELAATGECFDVLTIVVDVGPGTVISIDEAPGP